MALSRPSALDPALALDEPLRLALADADEVGRPTRLSVEIRLYHPRTREYRLWKDVAWKVEFAEVADGRAVVEGIDLLLRAMEWDEAGTLETLKARLSGSDGSGGKAGAA